MPTENKSQISSAEITAIYRSKFDQISGDSLSKKITSQAGVKKAQEFIEKYSYPLVQQKISARAGFMRKEALRLLASNNYDSIISFASGFSLLLRVIANELQSEKDIQFIDTDLEFIINERNDRIKKIESLSHVKCHAKFKTNILDLEEICQSNKPLHTLFPECKSPIFIIEGVIYFLSEKCVNWLIEQIAEYPQTAILMDYWPSDIIEQSAIFKRAYADLNQFIPEQTKSFWGKEMLKKVESIFKKADDFSIAEVEKNLSTKAGLAPKLLNPNDYFPLHVLSLEKGIITPGNFDLL